MGFDSSADSGCAVLVPGWALRGVDGFHHLFGSVVFVQRAAWLKDYFWGAMCVVIAVVFSPLFLATKIFILMGLTCVAACLAVVAGFPPQPLAAL